MFTRVTMYNALKITNSQVSTAALSSRRVFDGFATNTSPSNPFFVLAKNNCTASTVTTTSILRTSKKGTTVALEVRIPGKEQLLLQNDPKKYVKKMSSTSNSVFVYKTEYGKSFHAKGCGYLHHSKKKVSLAGAVADSLRPCKRCGGI